MLMYPDIRLDDNEEDQGSEGHDYGSCEAIEMTQHSQSDDCVSLEQIVHPLQNIANGSRLRFAYGGAETIVSGCCSFCEKNLDGYAHQFYSTADMLIDF